VRCASLLLVLGALAAGCVDETEFALRDALGALTSPTAPPVDHSNKYQHDARAIALGHQLYFDPDFSGVQTDLDMLNRPMTTTGRAPAGQHIGLSCNSCHDVTRHGGADPTPEPLGHRVSFGAGAYDVNGMQTIDAGHLGVVYWNGRNDSLWSQIVAVTESPVSMGGSRLRSAWRIADAYRVSYEAIFGPLPAELDSVAAQKTRLAPDGSCQLDGTTCPAPHCREVVVEGATHCLPRFPLEGRPGFVRYGQAPVCSFGQPADILQPNGDAYDCMDLADQLLVTEIYVNFAKAIAAYESSLQSEQTAFERWVDNGLQKGISISAQRGARLFIGKAACASCHSGPLFSDNRFHNIGVPQVGTYVPTTADCPQGGWCDCVSDDRNEPTNCLPWGARDGLRKLQANKFRRDSRWSDDEECRSHLSVHTDVNYAAEHPDQCDGLIGYYSLPLTDAHKGAWKTPPLRNVALTAPYMHTGAFATLADVIDHYDRGGLPPEDEVALAQGELVGARDTRLRPLNLTAQEKQDLVAFLGTLTGAVEPSRTALPLLPAASPF